MKNLGTKINPDVLRHYFALNELSGFTISECNHIISSVSQGNISQVIFDLGIRCIQVLSQYLEEKEMYEELAVIKRKINIHNNLTEENFKLLPNEQTS